jgi:ATP-dependent protease ClpP protease subunit
MSDEELEDVYTKGNTIFFFCDVTTKSSRDLCRELHRLSLKHDTIRVNIRSDGGCMYGGYAAMDCIRSLVESGTKVETMVLGYCASAAVDIFLAGSHRMMGRNSYVLIHQLSVDIGGTYNTLKVEMKNNRKFMRHARRICQEYTRIPPDVLEKLLKEDRNLSARKCLRYGIADELV